MSNLQTWSWPCLWSVERRAKDRGCWGGGAAGVRRAGCGAGCPQDGHWHGFSGGDLHHLQQCMSSGPPVHAELQWAHLRGCFLSPFPCVGRLQTAEPGTRLSPLPPGSAPGAVTGWPSPALSAAPEEQGVWPARRVLAGGGFGKRPNLNQAQNAFSPDLLFF